MISVLGIILVLLLIGGGVWGWPLVAAALGLSSVTDKSGALKHIKQLMNTYDITPAEVKEAFNASDSADDANVKRSKGEVARTLFMYLGAIFIVAGISTYIGTFWDSMGSVMRVAVTLGTGYVLLIVLVVALHEDRYPKLVLPMTLLSVFMMTSGWFVFLDEFFDGDNWRAATLFVTGAMGVHQAALFARYRRTVFSFTSLVFAYGFMHVGLDMLGLDVAYIAIILGASVFLVGTALEKTPHSVLSEMLLLVGICWLNTGFFDRVAEMASDSLAAVLVGICLMLTAYGFHRAERYPRLIALGYFTGSLLAYIGLFDLVEGTPFELIYLAITAAALYGCVVLESRALLLTTVIAMLGFIGYYSAEYFADSLGWPITLVLMGLAFLGVGAMALRVKRQI
jgi:hypothetical protein